MPLYAPPSPGALYSDDPGTPQALSMFDTAFPQGSRPPVTALQDSSIRSPDLSGLDAIQGPSGKVKRPGLLGRIMQQPGGSKALLAFGASLLSNPDFFSGLGQGALAYRDVLDNEADKLKPKLTKDAAFTYSINPTTGEPIFERTPVADFQEGLLNKKLASAETTSKYRTDVNADIAGNRLEKQDQWHSQDNDLERWKTEKMGDWKEADRKNALEIAKINADARQALLTAQQQGRQVPVGAIKEFDTHAAKVNTANGTLDLGNQVLSDLQSGKLKLGLLNNLGNKAAAVTGIGANEATRSYSQLQQFTQILVNSILMDARGVQTDGDAERAKIESLVSSGDNEGAQREIANALRMIERGRDYAQGRASDIARQYGIDATSTAPSISGRPTVNAPRAGQTSSGTKWRIVG